MTFAMRESGRGRESSSEKVNGPLGPRSALVLSFESAGGTRVSEAPGVVPGCSGVLREASGVTVPQVPRVGELLVPRISGGAWGPQEGRRREGRRGEREGEERRREERDAKTWELWR